MTTPLKPGVVDANVLVYAMDTQAPQYSASRALLDAARTGLTTLYVSSQVLCEFYSIITNVRRVLKPRSPEDALSAVSDLLGILQFLPITVSAIDSLIHLIGLHTPIGAEVFDLQIVATMKANGILRIYTYNTEDFEVFPELEVLKP